jgi:hypothetical protein
MSGRFPQTELSETAARLRQSRGDGIPAVVFVEIFECDRQPPAPVRMFVEGARNIDLLKHPHDVIQADGNKTRWRLREKPRNRDKLVTFVRKASFS